MFYKFLYVNFNEIITNQFNKLYLSFVKLLQFSLNKILRLKFILLQYKCDECDMTCPTRSALANHVAYRHSDEKNFPCKEQGLII